MFQQVRLSNSSQILVAVTQIQIKYGTTWILPNSKDSKVAVTQIHVSSTTLWQLNIAMEHHHAINGKIHYFYGHVQ